MVEQRDGDKRREEKGGGGSPNKNDSWGRSQGIASGVRDVQAKQLCKYSTRRKSPRFSTFTLSTRPHQGERKKKCPCFVSCAQPTASRL